jgi:hypothetical protein
MACCSADLEKYDYRGAQSLIRATDGTILERCPAHAHPEERLRAAAYPGAD